MHSKGFFDKKHLKCLLGTKTFENGDNIQERFFTKMSQMTLVPSKYCVLEKEARVAWQLLVNPLGTHTYKFNNLRTSGPRIGLWL